MTPDPAPLQESIARRLMEALDPHSEIIAVHEGYGAEVVTHAHQSAVVAAVLPLIAAEVQAAKAEAWDEATRIALDFAHRNQEDRITLYLRPPHNRNPYRATETGDQA